MSLRWGRSVIGSASLLASLCAALLVPQPSFGATASVNIQARAIKSTVLVGEPLILSVTVTTTAGVIMERDLGEKLDPLRVFVDRGQGFVAYREKLWASSGREPRKPLPGGQRTIEYVISYDASLNDWVFPAPGIYRIMVQYQDEAVGSSRSNVVTVTVQAPTGDEKTVHDNLLALGPQLIGVHQSSRLGQLKPLVDQFSTSVYLQESRINDLHSRMADIANGYDPNDPPHGGTPDHPPMSPNHRPEVVKERLSALIADADAVAAVSGPFQPEAMLIQAGLYAATGDQAAARQVYEKIVLSFPDREAAKLAQQEVGDTTPPALQVTASPSSLWPPDHKLIPIAVTVQANDDMDPNPTVKLISITCDDGCNPSQDVAGATLDTDDRAFQLVAWRTGSGSGRTYTITYSATDASGNRATATTKVRVPHDQGQ